MKFDLRSKARTIDKIHVWGVAALITAICANLLLVNICADYFSLLEHGALLGSRVDERGGLWEIHSIVPFLIVVAVLSGLAAAKLNMWKRLAVYLTIAAIVTGFTCFTLVHFIHGSLR